MVKKAEETNNAELEYRYDTCDKCWFKNDYSTVVSVPVTIVFGNSSQWFDVGSIAICPNCKSIKHYQDGRFIYCYNNLKGETTKNAILLCEDHPIMKANRISLRKLEGAVLDYVQMSTLAHPYIKLEDIQ